MIAVSLLAMFEPRPSAQSVFPTQPSLTFSVFERYLESFQKQASIPGLSALILQDGVIVWERGFGRADIERALEPTSFTAFQIGSLSQVMGATRWQVFRHVKLPLLRPVIVIAVVIRTMEALKIFDMPMLLTQGGPGNATETISISSSTSRWGRTSAATGPRTVAESTILA